MVDTLPRKNTPDRSATAEGRQPRTAEDFEATRAARRERLSGIQEYAAAWKDYVSETFADPKNKKLAAATVEKRLDETRRRYADLKHRLRVEDFQPEVWAELLEIMVDGLLNTEDGSIKPIDLVEDLVIRIERIRRLVRDTLDDHVYQYGRDQRSVVEQVNNWLKDVSVSERAALFGISTKQFGRWAASESDPSERLVIVATAIAILQRALTQRGIISWFHRNRDELDGLTPLEHLDATDRDGFAVVELARRSLSQRAT